MKDWQKILIEVILMCVAVYFTLLVFASCKSKKAVVRIEQQQKVEQIKDVESNTTESEAVEEDFVEVTYVLDSAQYVGISDRLEGIDPCKVKEIRVKASHTDSEIVRNNTTKAREEKDTEQKEDMQVKEKVKPATSVNVWQTLFIAFVVVTSFFLIRLHIRS